METRECHFYLKENNAEWLRKEAFKKRKTMSSFINELIEKERGKKNE